MPRTFSLALAISVLLVVTTASHAVNLRVTELICGGCLPEFNGGLGVGGTLTIGIRVDGDPGEEIFGLGASVHGYDNGVAQFDSGQAVDSFFHDFADPQFGAFDGLANLAGGALVESSIPPNDNRVQILNAASLVPRSSNPLDPGLDGVVGGGDAQIRIRFVGVGAGITHVVIGTGYSGDVVFLEGGVTAEANNAVVVFGSDTAPYVVPEPGRALLLSVGLLGLTGLTSSPGGRLRLPSAR